LVVEAVVAVGGIVEGGKRAVGLFPRPLGERVRVRGGRGRGGEKIPLTPALSRRGEGADLAGCREYRTANNGSSADYESFLHPHTFLLRIPLTP
jgi:hypothetical protein